MYYRSGTGADQTLHVHSPGGSSFLHEMTSKPPSWSCDVKSDFVNRCVFTRGTIPQKFHSDPIWIPEHVY